MKKILHIKILFLLIIQPVAVYCADITRQVDISIQVSSDTVNIKRINCNGSLYITDSGDFYSSDAEYTANAGLGYILSGSVSDTANPIMGTVDQELYQTGRLGNIEYRFDVPAGMYDITLKFAETVCNSQGERVFNVYLQDLDNERRGIKVLGDFDIFAEAGGKNTSVDRTISNITVNEGFLKVTFEGIVNQPLINAIEVKSTPYVIGDIGMSDADFINIVEYNAFKWFKETAEDSPYYFVPAWGPADGYWSDVNMCNIAGIGFQLIVYCIGIERNWFDIAGDNQANYNIGYSRIKKMFEGIRLMEKVLTDGTVTDNPYDRYCHFYNRLNPDPETGAIIALPSGDTDACSIFDNGDFMMGVVFAAEYFKGTEIELMARQVYESFDWNKYGDRTWPEYSEEMIGILLGASSARNSCRNNSMVAGFNNATGDVHSPLYFYQWLNLFYDGRNTTTPSGRNDYNFAREATLSNRLDCITMWQNDPVEYNTYDWDTWGYTAAQRADEYGFDSHYGGDVNPFAVAASMPFAPDECLNAMKHMYFRFYKNGFRAYMGPIWSDLFGFGQTYNVGTTYDEVDGVPWQKDYYSWSANGDFDFGSVVMGLENYRSQFVWNTTMNSDYIKAGMYRIGMTGYTEPPAVNIAENKTCVVSSSVNGNSGSRAVDDDLITRWESDYSSDSQWVYVDLEDVCNINKIDIFWENAYAVSYKVQASNNASDWTDVYSINDSDGAVDRIQFSTNVIGRYIRIYCMEKSLSQYGYSIWGIKVFGDAAAALEIPVIETLTSPDNDGDYQINWNDINGAVIYQWQESSDPTFAAGTAELWPTASYQDIFGKTNGTYYYRVKAWSNTDTAVGISSEWSAVRSVTVEIPSGEAVFILGTKDNSDAEFLQSDYVYDFFPDDQAVGEMSKEVSDWYMQYIHFSLTQNEAGQGITFILDPAWNNGTGTLEIAVDVFGQGDWREAGRTLLNNKESGYVDIHSSFLKTGMNDMRFRMVNGTGGTTAVAWDQIKCLPASYTAVWSIGINDESSDEFLGDYSPEHYNADNGPVSDFNREINIEWWNYQYIDFNLTAQECQKAAVLSLDIMWNNNSGGVNVDLERWDGSDWVEVGEAELSFYDFKPGVIIIPVNHLKEGFNEWRLKATDGPGTATAVVWDCISLYQRDELPEPVNNLLEEILDTSLNFYLSPEAVHSSGLPLTALKIGDRARFGYSNPTEWGYAIQAWIAAAERSIITDVEARNKIDNALTTMRTLQNDPNQFKYGLFYPYYTLVESDGSDVAFPYHDSNHWLPSGDCALLYGSLNVAEGWFRLKGYTSAADKAQAVKNDMNFKSCYYQDTDTSDYYIAHIINADTGVYGEEYGVISKWNIYADEGGMVAFIAYLSGSLTSTEYQNVLNSQMRSSAVWDGHYVHEAAWFNAMFTWAQRGLVGVPMFGSSKERAFGVKSFIPNVTSHLDYADFLGIDYPGFSDAMTQADGGQGLVGRYAPPNLDNVVQTDVPGHIMPHAFAVPFCGLDVLDEVTLKRLFGKWVLLKCDISGVWHPEGTQDPYGFEVIASPQMNQVYNGADAGRYIFENLSHSYLSLSIYEGLSRCGNNRTFYYFASQLQEYNEKLSDIMNYVYPNE